jgi:imidazolonepropionase-like amidohydrolase
MRTMRNLMICAALLGLLGLQPPSGRAALVIRDVTVVSGPNAVAHATIVVRDGRVTAVQTQGTEPDADRMLNGKGLFAIPGLIDGHVHLSGSPWREQVTRLRRAVEGGVTSVFDMAGDTRETGDFARAAMSGEIVAPTIGYASLMAGPAFFTDPRAIGASAGFSPGAAPWMRAMTPDVNVVEAIAAARGTGATAIKLYAALDAAAVHRITAEAHRQGLKVFAHATVFPAKPSDLVDAGVDLLAHSAYLAWEGSSPSTDYKARARGDFTGVPADGPAMQRLLESVRQHGTALNPTLKVFAGMDDGIAAERTAWMNAVTRRAAALGIPIVAGTDGLIRDRDDLPALHDELELEVTGAGLSPAQALASATSTAARALGLVHRGCLEPGCAADLVLLEENPLADIRHTRKIRYVIKDGRLMRRDAR